MLPPYSLFTFFSVSRYSVPRLDIVLLLTRGSKQTTRIASACAHKEIANKGELTKGVADISKELAFVESADGRSPRALLARFASVENEKFRSAPAETLTAQKRMKGRTSK